MYNRNTTKYKSYKLAALPRDRDWETMLVKQVNFHFTFNLEYFETIPYLEWYHLSQFGHRMMKAYFGKFLVSIGGIDFMTVPCHVCRYLSSHGEFSLKTART